MTLAAVTSRPEFGWNELTVENSGRYRWLRYVGPDGGYGSVAEIEFIAPALALTVQARERLRQLADNRVVTSYRNKANPCVAGGLAVSTVHEGQLPRTSGKDNSRT